MHLLQVKNHAPLELPLVHLLENPSQVFQLLGAEMGLDEASGCEVQCLNGLLTTSDSNTNNLNCLRNKNTREGCGDRLHLTLWDTDTNQGASKPYQVRRPLFVSVIAFSVGGLSTYMA